MAVREPPPIRRPSNASARRRGGRRGVLLLLALALAVTVGVVASEWLGAPTRVLVIGDSLTSESTPAFNGTAGDLGLELHAVGRFGSGLVDADGYWAHEVPRLVAGFDPDIVIVEFIGNYGLFGVGPGISRDTPAFYAAWRAAAQGLEKTLTAHGAQVYWVLGPPLEDPVAQQRVTTIDDIYR